MFLSKRCCVCRYAFPVRYLLNRLHPTPTGALIILIARITSAVLLLLNLLSTKRAMFGHQVQVSGGLMATIPPTSRRKPIQMPGFGAATRGLFAMARVMFG